MKNIGVGERQERGRINKTTGTDLEGVLYKNRNVRMLRVTTP